MSKGIKKLIKVVLRNVNKEITGLAKRDNLYSGGLASEGYAGGYRDALYDVLFALNGGIPNRNYWRKEG